MQSPRCPSCHSTPDSGDVFCASCGAALAAAPGSPSARHRSGWGRRLLTVVVIVLLLGAVAATGAVLRASSAVGTLQRMSQPPAQVAGTALGLADDHLIDTGPARTAVGNAEASEPASDASWWDGLMSAVARVPETVNGAAVAAGAQPTSPSPMTILLLGVDARPGEAIDIGIRADAIALLRLDPADRSCRILAIPRDSRADLPGYGASKINHALAVGGIPYQEQVVEGFLGIEIDHYALGDFAGFAGVVDAIGGVTITVDEPFTLGEYSFTAGEQRLSGDQALAYVRYRGGADGDFGRIDRQQHVLRAIAQQVSGMDLLRGISQILATVEGHVRTDLSPVELASLIAYYQGTCGTTEIAMETLSGETATFPDPLVGQELSFVVVSDEEKAARVAALLGDGS